MNPDEYRRQLEAQLAALAADNAQDKQEDASASLARDDATVEGLIAVLADSEQAPAERLSALERLRASQFVSPAVLQHHAEYTDALRTAVRDRAPEVSVEALEVLAANKDPMARDILLEGLQAPDAAIVPAATALQFLSYDDHNNVAPVVRQVVQDASDEAIIAQGLRLLANDPGSEELFASMLLDQSRSTAVRELGALGLNAVNAARFGKLGRRIVEDEAETDAMRSEVLGNLTFLPEQDPVRANKSFGRVVGKLAIGAGAALAVAAIRYAARAKQKTPSG